MPFVKKTKPTDAVATSTPPSPPTRTRAPVNPWHVSDDARQLGIGQKTHGSAVPTTYDTPDERFRPLLIMLPKSWDKQCPEYISWRLKHAIAMTTDDVAKADPGTIANAYIYEFGIRQYLNARTLRDDVYDAMRARIITTWEEDPKAGISIAHKSMLAIEDGDVLVDFHKNAGPYYLEALLGIERHHDKLLQRVA